MIEKICIIGVGLIGGSLAKALKNKHYVKTIMGFSRHEENLKTAKKLEVIDDYSLNIETALFGANIVIIATPVNSFKTIFKSIKPYLTEDMIITDVGSTKGSIINAAKEVFVSVPVNFVGAHPIAGKEKNSVEESEITLFKNKRVIITPLENTNQKSLKMIKDMWQQTGALIETMSVAKHDEVLAMTSHLPHILAYALIDDFIENHPEAFDYTAGGFKDFSRIASSDAIMWRDICLNNSHEIIKQVEQYKKTLDKLILLIKNNKADELEKVFSNAKEQRDNHFNNKNNQ
jgi:prephenate dehydrogenase